MISKVRWHPKFNLGKINAYKQMFAMKFSMEKQIKNFWVAGFFLPGINATALSSKVEFVCSFFGRNVGLKKSFRLSLTFRYL